jgi:hypothetical protein
MLEQLLAQNKRRAPLAVPCSSLRHTIDTYSLAHLDHCVSTTDSMALAGVHFIEGM